MRETNPFKIFCPENAKYLILGSFYSAKSKKGVSYDWYYSNGRNQFWPILESLYNVELKSKNQQQELFENLNIAIADIIYQCDRVNGSSLDSMLKNIVYNTAPIAKVLTESDIQKIFFTSRFVEKHYTKQFKALIEQFPNMELITLPSPSPRYARVPFEDKVAEYMRVLPKT